jgi:hypothetical protein
LASGDLQAARGYFEESLKISRQLAQDDPLSAEKKRDLWVLHWRVANLLESQSNTAAQDHWRKAHDILAAMVQARLHVSPQDLALLEQLRTKVGAKDDTG